MATMKDTSTILEQKANQSLQQDKSDELEGWTLLDKIDAQMAASACEALSDSNLKDSKQQCQKDVEENNDSKQSTVQGKSMNLVKDDTCSQTPQAHHGKPSDTFTGSVQQNVLFSTRLVHAALHMQQYSYLFTNPEDYHRFVYEAGVQYAQDTLQRLVSYKTHVWKVLDGIIQGHIKSKTDILEIYDFSIVITQLPQHVSTLSSQELYVQQDMNLLKDPMQYWSMVELVGCHCSKTLLEQLTEYAKQEWNTISDISHYRERMAYEAHYVLERIVDIMIKGQDVDNKTYYRRVMHQFNDNKDNIRFNLYHATALRLILQALTLQKLVDFSNGITQIKEVMCEVIDNVRRPIQSTRDKIIALALTPAQHQSPTPTNFFRNTVCVDFTNMGAGLNTRNQDMLLDDVLKQDFRQSITYNAKIDTLLLLYEYILGMLEVIQIAKSVRM